MKTEYENFVTAVEKTIMELTKGKLQVTKVCMDKNNGVVYEGIMVRDKCSNMAPTIYLEEFFREFQRGKSLEEISREVLAIYEKTARTTEFDVEYFKDFSQIKQHIVYRIINREKNQLLLKECPYVTFLDLAVVPYVSFQVDGEKNGAILIKRTHLQMWNVDEDELFAIAAKNTPRQLGATITKLEDTLRGLIRSVDIEEEESFIEFLKELEESEDKIPMYVLSNRINLYGAACMLYENVLEMFAQELGEDVYILPSSVHEVLLVPVSKALPLQEMLDMVCDINDEQIPPEEVLSDHIYRYSLQQQGFQML